MDRLIAHSLNEAYFYLMVTHCRACGQGPLHAEGGRMVDKDEARPCGVTTIMDVTCTSCAAKHTYTFVIPKELARIDPDRPRRINTTDEPSQIVDVARWITLYRMLCESADNETNKTRARTIRIEAGYCLEEALKFYQEDSELPPEEAFFHDTSRDRLKKNPEQFSRSRLIHLLSLLPVPSSGSSGHGEGLTKC